METTADITRRFVKQQGRQPTTAEGAAIIQRAFTAQNGRDPSDVEMQAIKTRAHSQFAQPAKAAAVAAPAQSSAPPVDTPFGRMSFAPASKGLRPSGKKFVPPVSTPFGTPSFHPASEVLRPNVKRPIASPPAPVMRARTKAEIGRGRPQAEEEARQNWKAPVGEGPLGPWAHAHGLDFLGSGLQEAYHKTVKPAFEYMLDSSGKYAPTDVGEPPKDPGRYAAARRVIDPAVQLGLIGATAATFPETGSAIALGGALLGAHGLAQQAVDIAQGSRPGIGEDTWGNVADAVLNASMVIGGGHYGGKLLRSDLPPSTLGGPGSLFDTRFDPQIIGRQDLGAGPPRVPGKNPPPKVGQTHRVSTPPRQVLPPEIQRQMAGVRSTFAGQPEQTPTPRKFWPPQAVRQTRPTVRPKAARVPTKKGSVVGPPVPLGSTDKGGIYYYTDGDFGMTSSGTFTKDRSRWITFDSDEAAQIGDKRPYSARRQGIFTNTVTGQRAHTTTPTPPSPAVPPKPQTSDGQSGSAYWEARNEGRGYTYVAENDNGIHMTKPNGKSVYLNRDNHPLKGGKKGYDFKRAESAPSAETIHAQPPTPEPVEAPVTRQAPPVKTASVVRQAAPKTPAQIEARLKYLDDQELKNYRNPEILRRLQQERDILQGRPPEASPAPQKSTPPVEAPVAGAGQTREPWPLRVQRVDEPNAPVPSTDKPHGLYTTPANGESAFADLGGKTRQWDTNPNANVLDLSKSKPIAMREGATDSGSGVHAAKQLLGDAEFKRLSGMGLEDLKAEAQRLAPGADFSRYVDKQEVMEGIGGTLARQNGYDALYRADADPAFSEYVGLSDKAMTPTPEPSAATPSKVPTTKGARVKAQVEAPVSGTGQAREPSAKQPWQMSLDEYVKSKAHIPQTYGQSIGSTSHIREIRAALAEGKPVPPSVLQEYLGSGWAEKALAEGKITGHPDYPDMKPQAPPIEVPVAGQAPPVKATPVVRPSGTQAVVPGTFYDAHGNLRAEVSAITPHPEVMQYKTESVNPNTGQTPNTSIAEGAPWNEKLAGTSSMWYDANGELGTPGEIIPVNGHNRYGKALDTGQPSMPIKLIDAATAAEARRQGALENITEGHGTPLDAGKLFRDMKAEGTKDVEGALQQEGLTFRPQDRLPRLGLGLSKLSDDAWNLVWSGKLSPEHGAIIGDTLGANPMKQNIITEALLKARNEGDTITNAEVQEMASEAAHGPVTTYTQQGMFGTEEVPIDPLKRVRVVTSVRSALGRDKTVFGQAAKNAKTLKRGNTEVDIERARQIEKESRGSLAWFEATRQNDAGVRGIIDDAARAVQEGKKNASQANADALTAIKTRLQELAGENASPRPVAGKQAPNPRTVPESNQGRGGPHPAGPEEGSASLAAAPPKPQTSEVNTGGEPTTGTQTPAQTLYHGGPEITGDALVRGGRQGQDAGGIFFTENKDYASQYARPHVYEAKASDVGANIFDPRKPEHLAQLKKGFLSMVGKDGEYATRADALRDYAQVSKMDLLDWATGSQYSDAIEAAGFDGAILKERPGNVTPNADGSFDVSGEPIYSIASYRPSVKVIKSTPSPTPDVTPAQPSTAPAKPAGEGRVAPGVAKPARGRARQRGAAIIPDIPNIEWDQVKKAYVDATGKLATPEMIDAFLNASRIAFGGSQEARARPRVLPTKKPAPTLRPASEPVRPAESVRAQKPVEVPEPRKTPVESPSGERTVRMNLDSNNAARESMGLEPLGNIAPELRQNEAAVVAEATRLNLKDSAVEYTRKAVADGQKLTPQQTAGVVQKAAELITENEKAVASGDRARIDATQAEFDGLSKDFRRTGTVASHEFAIRKLAVKAEDYTYATAKQAKSENLNRPLTEKESIDVENAVKELKDLKEQIPATEARHAEELAKRDAEIERLKAEKLVQKEAAKNRANTEFKGNVEKIRAERYKLVAEFKDLLVGSPHDVVELSIQGTYKLGQIAGTYVREGVASLQRVVALTRAELEAAGVHGISDEQIIRSINAKNPAAVKKVRSQAQVQAAALKQEARLMTEIEDLVNGRSKPRTPTVKTPPSPVVEGLLARLKELKAQQTKSSGDAKLRMKKEAAIESLIDQLEGHYRTLKASKGQNPPKFPELDAQLKELRRTLNSEDTLLRLNDELRTGNFTPPKARTDTVIPGSDLEKLQIAIREARREVNARIGAKNTPIGWKGYDLLNNEGRSNKATADISFTLRQALDHTIIGLMHDPIGTIRTHGKALKTVFSKYTDEQINNAAMNEPEWAEYVRHKGKWTEHGGASTNAEEFWPESPSDKLPLWGAVKKASERHARTLSNLLPYEAFKRYKSWVPNATTAELDAVAGVNNILMKRGDLGAVSAYRTALSRAIFSPSNKVANLEYPFLLKRAWKYPKLRNQVLLAYGGRIGGAIAVLGLAKLAGYKVGMDPDKGEFGKIGVPAGGKGAAALSLALTNVGIGVTTYDGTMWIDIHGGQLQAVIRPAFRLAVSHKLSARDMLGGAGTGGWAPLPSTAWELRTGKNAATGQPVTPLKSLLTMPVPMGATDAWDAYTGNYKAKPKGKSSGGLPTKFRAARTRL